MLEKNEPRDLVIAVITGDWRPVLEQDGCPVCVMLTIRARRQAWGFQWEHVTDPEIRTKLRDGRGFCHTHAWLCYDIGNRDMHSLLGYAGVAADLMALVEPDLTALAHREPLRLGCPYCADERRTEAHLCRQLLRGLSAPAARQAFNQALGLCTAHFVQLAALQSDGDERRALYTTRATLLSALQQRLDAVIQVPHADVVQARRRLRQALAITSGLPVWPSPRSDERLELPVLPPYTSVCPLCQACRRIQVDGPLCARHAARRWLDAVRTDDHLPTALQTAARMVDQAHAAITALQAAPLQSATWWRFGGVQRRITAALHAPACAQCAAEEDLLRNGGLALAGAMCMPHLRALVALRAARNGRGLPADIAERQRRLAHELAEYQRKHDYRYHDEGWSAERTVVERVWSWLVGAPEILGGPVTLPNI